MTAWPTGRRSSPRGIRSSSEAFGSNARRSASRPRLPERWEGLIGEYGWDHDVLYILEQDGRLHALIEWFFDYPLEEVGPDRFRFPKSGLYDGEDLIFTRDAAGRATQVEAASVVFRRRQLDGEDGTTFRITPVRPVEELRARSARSVPPDEAGTFRAPDLVDLAALDPTIKLDIRYATANNFLGTPVYTSARAFLQRPAAEALVRAHRPRPAWLRPADPRRVSPLARDQAVLGCDPRIRPSLRRRSRRRARSTTGVRPWT